MPERWTVQRAISALLLCLLATASAKPTTPRRHCGTHDPNAVLRATHAYLQENERLDNDLHNASTLQAHHHSHPHPNSPGQAINPFYTVDTYFHIVSDNASASPSSPNYVTDAMITAQFQTISIAYTNASIGYTFRGYSRTINSTWASNGDDLAMKTALRNGTYSALNVYFQSLLQAAPGAPGVPPGSVLLGYCSLPEGGVTADTLPYVYALDGCNVLSSTMPDGGTFTEYNAGGTAVHEIGHWNGLLHPFQDNTCASYDYGDYVADTLQEMTSTSKTGVTSAPRTPLCPIAHLNSPRAVLTSSTNHVLTAL